MKNNLFKFIHNLFYSLNFSFRNKTFYFIFVELICLSTLILSFAILVKVLSAIVIYCLGLFRYIPRLTYNDMELFRLGLVCLFSRFFCGHYMDYLLISFKFPVSWKSFNNVKEVVPFILFLVAVFLDLLFLFFLGEIYVECFTFVSEFWIKLFKDTFNFLDLSIFSSWQYIYLRIVKHFKYEINYICWFLIVVLSFYFLFTVRKLYYKSFLNVRLIFFFIILCVKFFFY